MSGWKKKRSIMRRYDLTAHLYNMRYAEEQTAKFKAALDELKMEKFVWALDVGCGTGILFDYIAAKAEAMVGLDISRKILVYAKNRAKNLCDVHLILADADNIPIREGVFTHVFGITVLQNMPKPTKTLEEIKRVAKENAVIVVSGLKKSFTKEEFEELLRHAHLKPFSLKSEGLKCYVAVCTKIYH